MKRSIQAGQWVWHDVPSPSEKTLKELVDEFNLHHLAIEDCLSKIQRPKIDEYDGHLFIVLHLPVVSRRTKQVKIEEVDIFIGQTFVISVHRESDAVEEIFQQCEKSDEARKEYMAQGTGYFLYKLISQLFNRCFVLLDQLVVRVNDIEQDIFERASHQDMLTEILSIKKDIINFRRIIIPQRTVIAQLEHKNTKYLPENLEVYFDDVVDRIEKIWSSLENLKELVESLQETNESIISHNTNNIIRVLTIFSVVMLPLTLLSGIYGMNINTLPFAQSVNSFGIIIGMMAAVVMIMLFYFKYKRWL